MPMGMPATRRAYRKTIAALKHAIISLDYSSSIRAIERLLQKYRRRQRRLDYGRLHP